MKKEKIKSFCKKKNEFVSQKTVEDECSPLGCEHYRLVINNGKIVVNDKKRFVGLYDCDD